MSTATITLKVSTKEKKRLQLAARRSKKSLNAYVLGKVTGTDVSRGGKLDLGNYSPISTAVSPPSRLGNSSLIGSENLRRHIRGDGLISAKSPPREDVIVFAVMADPKPQNIVALLHCQRPISQAHPRRPKTSDALKMERGVAGVALKQGEIGIGGALDGIG